MKPDYDSWFFSPLDKLGEKEKLCVETENQLDAIIDSYVAEKVIEDLRFGSVPMSDWLIDVIFGGEDELKKLIVEWIDETIRNDPMYQEIRNEWLDYYEAEICPVD